MFNSATDGTFGETDKKIFLMNYSSLPGTKDLVKFKQTNILFWQCIDNRTALSKDLHLYTISEMNLVIISNGFLFYLRYQNKLFNLNKLKKNARTDSYT